MDFVFDADRHCEADGVREGSTFVRVAVGDAPTDNDAVGETDPEVLPVEVDD